MLQNIFFACFFGVMGTKTKKNAHVLADMGIGKRKQTKSITK